jgi:hypothetical protein
MEIVWTCPNTSPVMLSIFKRFKIVGLRIVALKNPRPTIEDHFKLDIPPDGILLPQVRNGHDPAMPVYDAPGVHFEKKHKIQPLTIN